MTSFWPGPEALMLNDFLQKAFTNHFALGAFNLDSLETLKAVCLAVKKAKSPVIVEVSPGELNYLGLRNVASLVDNARREFDIPIFLNLDHAEDLDIIKNALDFGFSLVHFDGSKLPLEENISKAKQVVAWAHAKNVLVEGEVNHIFKAEENIESLTHPDLAKKFVDETGVDIFAVSIGNNHGVSEHEGIDAHLLEEIKIALPDQMFSLHGGSGIPGDQIREAINLGVVKVNINSELRMAFKQNLDLTSAELQWYKLTEKAIAEVAKIVEAKIAIFTNA